MASLFPYKQASHNTDIFRIRAPFNDAAPYAFTMSISAVACNGSCVGNETSDATVLVFVETCFSLRLRVYGLMVALVKRLLSAIGIVALHSCIVESPNNVSVFASTVTHPHTSSQYLRHITHTHTHINAFVRAHSA